MTHGILTNGTVTIPVTMMSNEPGGIVAYIDGADEDNANWFDQKLWTFTKDAPPPPANANELIRGLVTGSIFKLRGGNGYTTFYLKTGAGTARVKITGDAPYQDEGSVFVNDNDVNWATGVPVEDVRVIYNPEEPA